MTDPPLPTGYRLFEAFWRLLRGNAKLRFASLLVRSGTALAAGPPLVLALTTLFADAAFPRPPEAVATGLAVATPLTGVLLIALGVWLFLKHADPPRLDDSFGVRLVEGQSFEAAARTVLSQERKAVQFSGFSLAELARPVRGQEFEAADSVTVARSLGNIVVGAPGFPAYEVIESATIIEVRKV